MSGTSGLGGMNDQDDGSGAGANADKDTNNSPGTLDTAKTAKAAGKTAAPETAGTALETNYRKALMLLPRTYWAKHSEEMLAVLLDSAKPGQTKPNPREVLSVALLSLRLRFASANAGGRPGTVAGDIARRAVLAILIFNFAMVMQWNAFGGGFGHSFLPLLLQAGLIITLIQGWIWPARALCAVYAAYEIHNIGWRVLAYNNPLWWYVNYNVVTPLLIIVVAVVAFHRGAPRLPGRAWWCTAFATITAIFWLRGKTVDHMFVIGFSHTPTLPALLYAAAVGMALWKAKTSMIWPTALALAGLPEYGGTIVRFLMHWSPVLADSPRDAMVIELGMACEMILLCVALASFVFTRYQRRTNARGGEPV